LNAFKYRDAVQLMVNRRATPARQVARAQLSLRRWTGALIAIAAVVRSGVGVLSLFTIGPLSGLAAYPLWAVLGNGPIVVEWILAGLLVAAGSLRRKATSTRRIQRDLLCAQYVRKPRLTRTDLVL
jgi:hypothetical protein